MKAGAQRVYRPRDLASRPQVTSALLGFLVLVFFVQMADAGGASASRGLFEFVTWGPAIQAGDWWRIVTGGFLHGSLIHIAMNGYALWMFGGFVERGLGGVSMVLIYLGGLLGGSLAVVAFAWGDPTLGASGAVLGLAGGIGAVLWSRGVDLKQTSLGGIILLNLGLPLLVPLISFWGHFGGIAGGFLVGSILGFGERSQGASAARGVAIAVIVALGVGAYVVAGNGGIADVL